MYYIIDGHGYDYETQTIIQVFCPNDRYIKVSEPPSDGLCIFSGMRGDVCTAVIYVDGEEVARDIKSARQSDNIEKEEQRLVKLTIYNAFQKFKPERQPWGILTGIRPAKLVHDLWRQGFDESLVRRTLAEEYLVSGKKIDLCMDVARAEKDIVDNRLKNGVSIYIGVPFCPSRCLYCSFTSFPVGRYTKKMPAYFDALEKDIDAVADFAGKYDIETIYIGGGTPTSLTDAYLERLLYKLSESLDISNIKEYTVEAGRPDTVTREKLKILKRYGVSRISVNPQTMRDETLATIGRRHTAEDFLRAYEQALSEGFENINIDLILGLPGETVEDVENTFTRIAEIAPNAVTVHTLAVKRASNLNQNLLEYNLTKRTEMERMLDIAATYCADMGVLPYYMYRQKNMLGNFENVGYSKKGFECRYNVLIMEECQSILSAGAGAVTKLVRGANNKIDRVFNVKGIEEYIARNDEMLARKRNGGL